MVLSKGPSGEKREVQQYHFKGWPDHGVPAEPATVISFLQRIKRISLEIRKVVGPSLGPLIVHCSAGIGRTGTFIVIDIILNIIEQNGAAKLVSPFLVPLEQPAQARAPNRPGLRH